MAGAFNTRTRLLQRLFKPSLRQIADGVWLVQGGFPLKNMNVYLIEDEGQVTVFDAGIKEMTNGLASHAAGFGEERVGRCVAGGAPGFAAVDRGVETDKRPQNVPIEFLVGRLIQRICPVVPHAFVDQAARWIPSSVRRGASGKDAGIDQAERHRVITGYGDETRCRVRAFVGTGGDTPDLAIGPRRIQIPVGRPRRVPGVGVGITRTAPGKRYAGQ